MYKLLDYKLTSSGLLDELKFLSNGYNVICTALDTSESDMYNVDIECTDGSILKLEIDSDLGIYSNIEIPPEILEVIQTYMVAF